MPHLKVLIAVLLSLAAVAVVSVSYILGKTWGAHAPGGGLVGTDVALLPRMIFLSPTYWLVLIVVLAVLWWFLWGWLFSAHVHH